MSYNGDPTQTMKLTLDNLTGTDAAVPNLWDSRFQSLLNNDAVLNRRLSGIESGATAPRSVQVLADVAALRAFPAPTPGEAAYLPYEGLYKYYPNSSEAEQLPWVVLPDNHTGRWRLDMVPRALLGANGGVATLDVTGFLVQSVADGSVTASKLAPGAVTAEKFGTVTVDQTVTLATDTATLLQVISALANRLRAVTGLTNWRADPDVSLKTLNASAGLLNKAQSWTQKQTMAQLQVDSVLIIPVL